MTLTVTAYAAMQRRSSGIESSCATDGRSEGEVERSACTRCCSAGEYCGGSGATCLVRLRRRLRLRLRVRVRVQVKVRARVGAGAGAGAGARRGVPREYARDEGGHVVAVEGALPRAELKEEAAERPG